LVGGDFVLLPAPKVYSLRSNPKSPLRSVEQIISPEQFHRSRLRGTNLHELAQKQPTAMLAAAPARAQPSTVFGENIRRRGFNQR
jgi:hypothetical protein